MLIRYPIQQWAYVVSDVEAACAKWTELVPNAPLQKSFASWNEEHAPWDGKTDTIRRL